MRRQGPLRQSQPGREAPAGSPRTAPPRIPLSRQPARSRRGGRVTSAVADTKSTHIRIIKGNGKKAIILEYRAAKGPERAGARQIQAIQAELRRQSGPQATASR